MQKLAVVFVSMMLSMDLAGCDQETVALDTALDATGDTSVDTVADTVADTPDDTVADTEMDTAVDTAVDTTPDVVSDAEDAVTARVQFVTSMGTFVVGLYGNAAPTTVTNFLAYVDDGFFDGLIFHRVISDFMIQGGGFNTDLSYQSPTYSPIPLEIVSWLSHQPGVISMARTSDPDSATSQFFVCVSDDSFLDTDYASFGMTESGYDVVESISLVSVHDAGGMENVPVTNVVIESVTRL